MSERIKIVLVRPRNPDNIGACARAMSNFGFHELRLAGVFGPVWEETRQKADTAGTGLTEEKLKNFSKNSAVGAERVIDSAKTFPSLAEAVKDCSLVLGTSSLHRIKPERKLIAIKEAASHISAFSPSANTAVVLGPEKTGLTHEDLSHCHAVINIPTAEEQPSMNLGQSAAILCYELAGLNAGPRSKKGGAAVAPVSMEIEGLVNGICVKLRRRFGDKWGGPYHERIIRQALLDAGLNRHAVTVIKKFLD